MPKPATVPEYFAAQPPAHRKVLRQVSAVIRKALPGSTERISYQIPAVSLDGRMVMYFAGFRAHYAVYPVSRPVLAAMKNELAPHLHARATLRFDYDEPVPAKLLTRFAKLRAAEVKASAAKKPRRRA